MTFTELVVDVCGNVIGELIGGTFGEKVADFLLGKASEFHIKEEVYKKFIVKDSDSRNKFTSFFDTLNKEVNEKRKTDKKS